MKFILALLISCGTVIALHGQTESDSTAVAKLLKKGLYRSMEEIHSLSDNLTDSQKQALYRTYKLRYTKYVLLSIFPSFGVGSFLAGDMVGGFVCSSTMVIGAIVMSENKDDLHSLDQFIIGFGMLCAGYAIGLVLPWTYIPQRNEDLRDALRMPEYLAVKIFPGANLYSANGFVPTINLQLRF